MQSQHCCWCICIQQPPSNLVFCSWLQMWCLSSAVMSISLVFALLVNLSLPVSRCQRVLAKDCPMTATNGSLQPLYVLVLVPFPDSRPGSGFDGGLSSLPGARIARDEINNHSDILEGYHIELIEGNAEACSCLTSPDGLVNLVEYGIEAKCSPVVAIAGLICSSHTLELSRVISRGQVSLIALAAANSPIFELESDRYPHLWRFLGSASVYGEAALVLMAKYDWRRIGVVHLNGEIFYNDIAEYFLTRLQKPFSFGIDCNPKRNSREAVRYIRENQITVTALVVNLELAALILCTTYDEGLVYPHYIFLIFSQTHEIILSEAYGLNCTKEKITAALRGHILMYTQQVPDDSSIILDTTGEEYTHFEAKYSQEADRVKRDYFKSHGVQPQLLDSLDEATVLYDQLWSLALAINRSLPELERINMSLTHYTTHQQQVTHIIENHLSNLSFQGASGHVQFDSKRGVSTPVHFFVSSESGQVRRVGVYDPQNTADFHIDINSSDLPRDRLPIQYIVLPLSWTVVAYVLSCGVALFTTVVLVLYLYYRDHKEVKATSPYLSILVFIGCYLLCMAAAVEATKVAFVFSSKFLILIVSSGLLLIINGFGLILLTIFIKMFRIYFFFFSWTKVKRFKAILRSCSLFFIVLLLSVLPNLVTIILILVEPPQFKNSVIDITNTVVYMIQASVANIHFSYFFATYFGLFIIFILFFAFRTRKLNYPNFKDTKKVIMFTSIMIVCVGLSFPLYLSLRASGNEHLASLVYCTAVLFIATICLMMLYVPKLPPAISLGEYCRQNILKTHCVC